MAAKPGDELRPWLEDLGILLLNTPDGLTGPVRPVTARQPNSNCPHLEAGEKLNDLKGGRKMAYAKESI